MITQIIKWGDSKVIILSPEFCKYMNLKISDWVDVSDIIKVEKIE